jgi:hypothetical protein
MGTLSPIIAESTCDFASFCKIPTAVILYICIQKKQARKKRKMARGGPRNKMKRRPLLKALKGPYKILEQNAKNQVLWGHKPGTLGAQTRYFGGTNQVLWGHKPAPD